MIPPSYFAAQFQAAQRKAQENQAVPNMENDGSMNQQESLFADNVLDLSKYLSSNDLPGTPREFFDDLFHERLANEEALAKALPGVIKIKKEPDSTATSRCSTPESLLPEHDFDNADFPTPRFRKNEISSPDEEGDSLMCQLQSIHHSNKSSEIDSDEEINVDKMEVHASSFKNVLSQFDKHQRLQTDQNHDVSSIHKDNLKSPSRAKIRRSLEKGSEEYIIKRERNNVAVRKSRTKAKLKHIETQMRVGELTEENEQLRNRVAALQKELNALKSFISYNNPSSAKLPFSSYPQFISNTKIM